MSKATETDAGVEQTEKDDFSLRFIQLSRVSLRQEYTHDFLTQTTDSNCIALLGCRNELLTLELTCKSTPQIPFPYVKATYAINTRNRPLDKLAKKLNLQKIYDHSNVLELQQLGLEAAYTAVTSQDVTPPKIQAAICSPQPLSNGHTLMTVLNSYGGIELLTKPREHSYWTKYENGLDIAGKLRDELLPNFVPAQIDTFKRLQTVMDRSWITMIVWRPLNPNSKNPMLVLGTAAGSLWTFTLSPDAQTLLTHMELPTAMGRICCLYTFQDLLLVGDNSGLIHLYRYEASGLCMVKELWRRADRMALQRAEIIICPEYDCFYIACCKGSHLLIWSMPTNDTAAGWRETRLLIGGMKITALGIWRNNSFVVGTARGPVYRVDLSQKSDQLSANKQPIHFKDCNNLSPMGIFSTPRRNLLTVLFARNAEYFKPSSLTRDEVEAFVGKLKMDNDDSLDQLASCLSANEPINCYSDLLTDIRLVIINRIDMDKYANYAPLDGFAFDGLASDSQLHQLQLKYHVLDALCHLQHYDTLSANTEMELLMSMLTLTHIRLRLQYLVELKILTDFQLKVAKSQFTESARIRQQLLEKLKTAKPDIFDVTVKRLLTQMEYHFDRLQQQLGKVQPETIDEAAAPFLRCSISCLELLPELDKHYCSLCGRQALLDQQLLLELYAPGSRLTCPYCHGELILELLDL